MKIFQNAAFISCEDNNRIFKFLAADNGRIVYAGDDLPASFSQAETVDLKGGCVVPAFGDTHIHFASFAYFKAGLDCRDVADFDELAALVHDYQNERPGEKVVVGFGCSAHTVRENRLPTIEDLDKITKKPLFIVKYDGHAAVGNSALLRKLPRSVLADEGFEKNTGWFLSNAFYLAVNHISKSVSIPRVFQNMLGGSDALARKGIALVHTAEGVGFPLDMDIDIMRFTSRGLPQAFRTFFQTMDVNKVLRRKMPRIGGCFATALDGCFGSEDAALKTPYSHDPSSTGTLFYPQKTVTDFVISANRKGLQVALHAIGDAAVSQALEAFDAALKDSPRKNHRHIIIHADLMDAAAMGKAADLGVCIALQTPFLHWPQEPVHYLEKILGDRIQHLIPLKSMLDHGLMIANGSDGPCTLPDPIAGIHAACNHPNQDQSVPVLEALRMHTSRCAELSFDDHERGTLSQGKKADFVVLNDNPLEIPVEKLDTLEIDAVYFGAEPYTSPESGALSLFKDSLMKRYP